MIAISSATVLLFTSLHTANIECVYAICIMLIPCDNPTGTRTETRSDQTTTHDNYEYYQQQEEQQEKWEKNWTESGEWGPVSQRCGSKLSSSYLSVHVMPFSY